MALKFGSEACVLKNGDDEQLGASQVKFLTHPVRINLDGERNQSVRDTLAVQNTVVPTKVATVDTKRHCSINRRGGEIQGA